MSILSGADLSDSNLSNANLINVIANDTNFTGAVLSGADLTDANIAFSDLENTLFSRSTTLPDSTNWIGNTNINWFTELEHPTWIPNLSGVYLVNANFSGTELDEADFSDANLMGADFSNADLVGADWSSDIKSAKSIGNMFQHLNLL